MPAPRAPGAGAKPLTKVVKTRYFKGKPGAEVDSESESEGDEPILEIKRSAAPKFDANIVAGGAGRVLKTDDKPVIKMELGSVKLEGGVKKPIEEESEDESDEEEEMKPPVAAYESSEYETESEEEEVKPAFRPVFVNKNARTTVTAEQAQKEAEEAEKRAEEERERRLQASKELAGETIRRELAEKEATSELVPDIDDTDGLDPEAEFDAWRARELARLLRDKTAQAEKDAEREEIERRRAMPEDVRMAEDMAYAEATRAQEKGEMGFLQKYYHKGAFVQDENDELFKRNYTAALESEVDKSALPEVMQVRDYGKRSRTKYKHLTAEDTSQGGWGTAHQAFGRPTQTAEQSQTGCWNCGGPHNRADCPNNEMGGQQDNPNVIDGVYIPGLDKGQDKGFGFGKPRGGPSGPPGRGGFGTAANTAPLGSGSRWNGEKKRPREDEGDRDSKSRREDRDRRDNGRAEKRDDKRRDDRGDKRDDRRRDDRDDRQDDRRREDRGDRRDDRRRDDDRRDRDRERRRSRSRSPRRDRR